MSYIKSVILISITAIGLIFSNVAKANKDITTNNIVTQYLQFQDYLGKSNLKNYTKNIKELFAPEILCISDGQVFAKGYNELEKRFLELKEMYGSWGVVIQKHTTCEDGTITTIQYELVTEKAGTFHVVSILHISKDQKISMIDESYYKLDTELDDE